MKTNNINQAMKLINIKSEAPRNTKKIMNAILDEDFVEEINKKR